MSGGVDEARMRWEQPVAPWIDPLQEALAVSEAIATDRLMRGIRGIAITRPIMSPRSADGGDGLGDHIPVFRAFWHHLGLEGVPEQAWDDWEGPLEPVDERELGEACS